MENLLRKYLWALDGLAVAVVAVLAAHAVSVGVVVPLLGQTSSLQPHPTRLPFPEPAPPAKDVDLIVQRNIFCSSCPAVDASAAPDAEGPAGPQKTALPLKLMAIMYAPAPAGTRWTTAVIRDTELAVAGPFRVGDAVHGATITEIRATRLLLDNAGRTEFLDLIDGSAGPGAPAPQAPAPAPAVAMQAPIPPPTLPPPAPPKTLLATELFKVRGDRIKRHPH